MKLIAFDLGIEKIGYAVFENEKLLQADLIKTNKTLPHQQRLWKIQQTLEKIIKTAAVDTLIMESLFYAHNQKTVIPVAQAQGVILALAGKTNLPIVLLTPLQIKHALTGDGHADKKQVLKMLQITQGPSFFHTQDDIIDAIACGLAYCYLNRHLLSSK